MRRLLILLPALVGLVGCGDGMYYQTRYIPTDINTAFAMSSGGEESELPASPPDLEGEHPERKDCTHPYQKFKPLGKVQVKPEATRSNADNGALAVAAFDDRMRLNGPDRALPGPKVAVFGNSPYAPGVTQSSFYQPIADSDRRPHSTTGAGTNVNANPVIVDGGLTSHNYEPYCCGDGPGKGTTNN